MIKNNDLNNITIYNHCPVHTTGFKITKSQLFERAVYSKNKKICTKCYPVTEESSIKEKELVAYIKSLDINIIENDRLILNGKELDILIPSKKIAIEFNGLYWHSELKKDKNYHLNKTLMCKEKNVNLIHIFEDEWMFKNNIVKSIIKSKLGFINNKIFARKCSIRDVDIKTTRKFLEENHIQGYCNSKFRIGLYYNDELVSFMSFSILRKQLGNKTNNPNHYLLDRFANKKETIIVGGASKLFNFFIKNHLPQKIISYADVRYSNGNLYKKLGFDFKHHSKPDYFYFNPKELKRYHRFNFRKSKITKKNNDIELSEHQIMLNNKKYLRIYDCGKLKFEFNPS